MMNLLILSLAPVLILLVYIYYRDKYEKEPWKILLKALFAGGLITIPVFFTERFLVYYSPAAGLKAAAFDAFIVAAFTEEFFKYIAFFLIIWNNRHFNEKFDGIVYAAFISLGFAAVENVLYVANGGFSVGFLRAFTAVPAHALFGIIMGYFLGLARFYPQLAKRYRFLALFWPIFFHGLYDFCLMSQMYLLMLLTIPLLIYLWISGFKKMKTLSDSSIYRF